MSTRVKSYFVYPGSPDMFLEPNEELIGWEWVPGVSQFCILVADKSVLPAEPAV